MSRAVDLSFIVPVRNDAVGVTRCLASIAVAAAGCPHEVIVLDNGSIDGSGQRARDCGATVFHLDGRVARLRNAGAQAARGRLLAFVDADHEIDPHWVKAALERLDDSSVAAAGAAYHPPPAANWVQRTYDLFRDHFAGVRDAAWLGSGNLVVRREHFEAVGGFDETLEACEDVDLCQRLRGMGRRVVEDSLLRSTHHGDPSTLRRLFISELWRGRDNLRVSLREPSLRELPSVLIPVIDLTAGIVAIVALLLGGWRGLPFALGAAAIVLALSTLRAWRMGTRSRVATTGRFSAAVARQLAQACCVALLYDVARALALVLRAPHRRVAGPLVSDDVLAEPYSVKVESSR